MEFNSRRSSGVAKGGLATGIVGTSLGALALAGNGANLFGNLFGRNSNCGGTEVVAVPVPVNAGWGCGGDGWNGRNGSYYNDGGCSENHLVNRYELGLQQQIAEKDSQIALRDANTYNDQKMLEMYKYIDGQLKDIRETAAQQAVINQKTADSFQIVSERMDCLARELRDKICDEARERRCNDNIIVTYANATFYPKSVADVTVGSTTTPQSTYNPLPCCCGNNGNN